MKKLIVFLLTVVMLTSILYFPAHAANIDYQLAKSKITPELNEQMNK